jgi:hypothetical protein
VDLSEEFSRVKRITAIMRAIAIFLRWEVIFKVTDALEELLI